MIRYLDISKDVDLKHDDGSYWLHFSWYDTITSSILTINGENVWSTWADFEHDCKEDVYTWDIPRFKGLFRR
jgi:hypothetical protein